MSTVIIINLLRLQFQFLIVAKLSLSN